jgi:hypothetical protein
MVVDEEAGALTPYAPDDNTVIDVPAPKRTRGRPKKVVSPNDVDGKVPPKSGQSKESTEEKQEREKKEKIESYTEKILTSVNEAILEIIETMIGIPQKVLYEKGYTPARKIGIPHLTPAGNALVFQPNCARAIAHVLADFEGTSIGTKFAKTTGNTGLKTAMWGITAGVLSIQYVQGSLAVIGQFKAMQAEMQANQPQENTAQEQEPDTPMYTHSSETPVGDPIVLS